jgi:two-component system LytT family response regulator
MIKALIIDDEDFAREVIKEYLEDHVEIEILGEFPDGFTGLKAINELHPDLVFLDVQMPKLSGFEILEVLDEKPMIIFTTAYDQYAIKAFEMNAVDYLLKPFSKDRFDAAIEKASEKKNKSNKESLSKLEKTIDNHKEILNRIVVKVRNEIEVLAVDKINYMEAQDDYVMIYTREKKYLKQKTMSFFEQHLDPELFLRVHRSYIVRIDDIQKIEPYEKSSSIIILKDGRKVPVSRTGLSKLKSKLGM